MTWLEWIGVRRPAEYVSEQWLKQNAQGERDEFIGVSIRWPIQKPQNDAGVWNTAKLKRRG